ncbi:MAG: hypothetical protein M3Q39_09990 [Actinomycetota bacterium]|nr:hypothetical protein [Actinomycetota bacterium]
MADTQSAKPTLSHKELKSESERSQAEIKPFTYECEDGQVLEFLNPKGIHWLDLASLGEDPVEFVQLCLSDRDGRKFMREDIDSEMMGTIMEDFTSHYGLGARGKGRGSRR